MAKSSRTYRSLSAFIALLLLLTAGTPLVLYACGIPGGDAATVTAVAPVAPGDLASESCTNADDEISECQLSECSTEQIKQDAVLTSDLSSNRTWLVPAAFVIGLLDSFVSPPPSPFYRTIAEDVSRPSTPVRLLTSSFLL